MQSLCTMAGARRVTARLELLAREGELVLATEVLGLRVGLQALCLGQVGAGEARVRMVPSTRAARPPESGERWVICIRAWKCLVPLASK